MRIFALPLLLLAPSLLLAHDVVRHKLPNNSTFPIAAAVEVPAGATTVYLSGMVPPMADATAPANTPAAYGDTQAQTVSVLKAIEGLLKGLGLTMGDVVKMQVFLVGVPEKDGAMDFDGFMNTYRKYFGTEDQPNLPARSAFQVAGLAAPGMLVEVEVVLARPAK
jgi:enamine deaminase RidA (YjgF/YER057c/UK114 family)